MSVDTECRFTGNHFLYRPWKFYKNFELYMKKKGRKYVRIRLKKTSLKNGRQVVRLAYSQKGYLVWFKARVYERGKKKNGVYSREKKIRL